LRATFDVLVAAFKSDPVRAAYAERESGVTTEQVVAGLLHDMQHAPSVAARDAMFSQAMAAAGIITTDLDAFDKGSEEMLARLESRDTLDERIRALSESSRRTPQYVSPERIRRVVPAFQQARLTQGLADRLRERDAARAHHDDKPLLPERAALSESREDDHDRYAALRTAVAIASHDRTGLDIGDPPDDASVRDVLTACFNADAERTAAADPLQDESLRALSNAV
jgi:hypothetical protein